jgi:hypothetical protein
MITEDAFLNAYFLAQRMVSSLIRTFISQLFSGQGANCNVAVTLICGNP